MTGERSFTYNHKKRRKMRRAIHRRVLGWEIILAKYTADQIASHAKGGEKKNDNPSHK